MNKRICFTLIYCLCAAPLSWARSQKELGNIYDATCMDLFVNPLYITNDPSNTLIYKPTAVHCLMVIALESSLEKEKNETRAAQIKKALITIKKIQNIFLASYQFAISALQNSDKIKKSQTLRLDYLQKY